MNKSIHLSIGFMFCIMFCLLASGNVLAQEKHVAAGTDLSLYLDPDGNVWTWGDTKLSRDINRRIPYIVMQNSRSVLGSTEQKSFVIKKDGSLWGWGDTSYGQMGIILETNDGFLNTPRKVMEQVKDVSGDGTIFALRLDGTLWVWGNASIQRGDKGKKDWTTPHKVMDNVEEVSSTGYHTVVRKKDGSLWAWGDNQCGALGTGDTEESVKPVRVDVKPLGNHKVVQIATRWGETYLLADDGTVWYSGEYNIRREGCLDPLHLVPTKLDTIDNVKAIALGQFHELYLKKDGSVWASGYGVAARAPFETVPTGLGKVMDGVVEIAGGQSHSIALKKDGTVWTWGENDLGQLGNGTNIGSATPVQVHFTKP
ncbi:RCC1 domain-containing protein [Oxalobacter formigenes]|uniref:RCC1 domain-containing protein n=1 Tax=Oxalobacter formigenes TaxID=847 RepID=UPI0022AE85A4|nr:hypothetical protein [Oxalobacter formigenes]WAW06389.1 hypothetical protein NB639_02985 [Oxalobacter formigenes]